MGFYALLLAKAFSQFFFDNFLHILIGVFIGNLNTSKMSYCTYFYILFINACLTILVTILS